MHKKYDNLFAYGGLTCPIIQLQTINRIPRSKSDILDDYTLKPHETPDDFPTAAPSKGKFLEGFVLINISKEEFEEIDRQQIDGYEKERLMLRSRRLAYVYKKPYKKS